MTFGSVADAPATLLLRGARVVDPASGEDAVRDLAVRDGRIVEPAQLPEVAPRVEAAGLIVAPGLVDLHAHLREPGGEGAETIDSGARAAAGGGFTTICAMPNTTPALDDPGLVAELAGRAAAAAAQVRWIGAVTRGRAGETLADLEALAAAGVAAFSDDGSAVPPQLLDTALARCAALDLPLIQHAEDATLAAGAVMRSGSTAVRLGLRGWPPEAELACVERGLAAAEATGAHLHLTHLSTAAALDAIRAARSRGVRVTCDVTPHHLALTDAWVAGDRRFAWEEPGDPDDGLAYDGRCRVNPPLPARDDALAQLAGLADGTIDAIATDHAPHPPERTLVPFDEAAPGLIGLETALSLGLAAVAAGRVPLPVLLGALSVGPAGIVGLSRGLGVGAVADLVAFDPAATWTVAPDGLASRSANTPLLGRQLPGVVRLTVAAGRVTWDDGTVFPRSTRAAG
ncbi:MAG TPA: dihydroorotase [Candidatus Limnocylindria bacterium]|nr:dihydroorotase [Candidatus Limnocylindria bacterium]